MKNVTETPGTALAEFDVTEAALAEIKEYESLEITDSKSEANVRKCRHVVRTMRTGVDKKRKELKAPMLARGKMIDRTAKELTARLLPTETILDEKVKAVENIAEIAKAEKMAAEKIRTDAILAEIAIIDEIVVKAQLPGLESGDINSCLDRLKGYEITEDIFQEFAENVQLSLEKNIEIVMGVLERTVKFEVEKKAQEELAEKNKIESDRLEKIAQEQEEALAEANIKANRDAEAAKIAAERKAFEDEKAALQAEKDRMAAEAEKVLFAERVKRCESTGNAMNQYYDERCREAYVLQISRSWDKAYEVKRVNDETNKAIYCMDFELAKNHDDQINMGQDMADVFEAARLESLKPDREKLLAFADKVESFEDPAIHNLGTDEAWAIFHSAQEMLKSVAAAIRKDIETL